MKEKEEMKQPKKSIKKMALWVLGLIVLIFILAIGVKMFVIQDLRNKVSQVKDSQNYYARINSYQGDYVTIGETYRKGSVSLSTLTVLDKENPRKMISYTEGTTKNIFIETKDRKVVLTNPEGLDLQVKIVDYLQTNNGGQFLIQAVTGSIKTETRNGKDCYFVKGVFPNMLTGENSGVYVDRKTGLPVRAYTGTLKNQEGNQIDTISDYYYEFDTVTDDQITKPDITQYTVIDQKQINEEAEKNKFTGKVVESDLKSIRLSLTKDTTFGKTGEEVVLHLEENNDMLFDTGIEIKVTLIENAPIMESYPPQIGSTSIVTIELVS